MANSDQDISPDPGAILTGTTLRVYRLMITSRRAFSAREVQKLLRMSTPSLATFHLEKLEKSGLVTKSESGGYSVSKLYLKHYFRIRRFLIPRYAFYAALSGFFVLGWIILLLDDLQRLKGNSFASAGLWVALQPTFAYGLMISLITLAIFLFEALRVTSQEQI